MTRQSFFQNGVTITTQLMILRFEKKSLYSSNFFQMLSLNIHIFVVVIFKHWSGKFGQNNNPVGFYKSKIISSVVVGQPLRKNFAALLHAHKPIFVYFFTHIARYLSESIIHQPLDSALVGHPWYKLAGVKGYFLCQVALQYLDPTVDDHVMTGVIISERFVVTEPRIGWAHTWYSNYAHLFNVC